MSLRVLVVHHVGALRRSFAVALELDGCSVVQAAHLDEAMEIAAADVPDVLVVDERAIRDAPDTFRRVKAHPRLSDVLVVALAAGVQQRGELIGRGVHGVVGKPVSDRDLVAGVRWVVDVYRRDDAADGLERLPQVPPPQVPERRGA